MQCVSGVISNSLTVTLYKSVKEMNISLIETS